MDEKLNRQIYKDLIKLYKQITEVYHPTRFKQMLFRYSGDGETIVNKLAKKNIYYGFEELSKRNKLNLTVETLIVEKYTDHFSTDVINKFKKRLEYGTCYQSGRLPINAKIKKKN
jgi:hypothetical protein